MFNFGSANNNSANTGTGGSLFGSKPSGSTSFSFGQTAGANNQQSTQPSGTGTGFSFGNNQQTQQPGPFGANQQNGAKPGGLFGSGTTASGAAHTSTGLFGNNTQPANNTSTLGQQSAVGSGGLFGNKTASGGLFGNSSQPSQNTTSGLFGASINQNTQPSTGGLFSTNTQSSNATGNGNLFGNPVSQNNGGAFGNSNQTSSQSGGLFGNKTMGTTTNGGLFGNKPNTLGNPQQGMSTTSGNLFGNQNQNQSNTGNGMFGQPANQVQNQTQPGLFGNTSSNSTQPSFAWSKSQTGQPIPQQQQQPFQQQQFQQPQAQMFQQPNQSQLQQQSNYPLQMQEQVIKCKESWDPTSNNTKLRSFVYNKVNENETVLYNKPPYVTQEEWDEAMDKKPSASCIPAEILGFEGLNQRTQLQRENVAQARVILNQILEKFTQLQQKHELDTAARITKAKSRNVQIEKRILRLGTQLAILKSRGLPLSVSEEKMWSQFQALLQRGNDPAGLGKTNELWARLAVLKERAKNISDQLNNTLVVINENGITFPNSTDNEEGNTTKRADEEVEKRLDKVIGTLSNQQRGIIYLNDVLDKDHKALDKLINNRSH